MKTCQCNESLGNTGTTGCVPIFKVAKKIIFVPTYANDGTRNKLDLSTDFTQAELDELVNHVDPSKRWYPTTLLENVTSERGEASYETAPSGRKAFVKQGTRNMTAEIWEQSSVYKRQLDKIRCNEVSIFILDIEGNLRGMISEVEDDNLYPIKIDRNSFNVDLMFSSDTTIEKLKMSFDFDQVEDDSLLSMVSAADISADLLEAEGLLDVEIKYGSITATSVTFDLFTYYGSKRNKVKVQGLVIGDFFSAVGGTASRLYNVTDGSPITITGLTENAGTYTATYTSQTAADEVRVTPVKKGYDFTPVVNNTYVAV
jgi:hypothetical protein